MQKICWSSIVELSGREKEVGLLRHLAEVSPQQGQGLDRVVVKKLINLYLRSREEFILRDCLDTVRINVSPLKSITRIGFDTLSLTIL
jgi:hypothetical protein